MAHDIGVLAINPCMKVRKLRNKKAYLLHRVGVAITIGRVGIRSVEHPAAVKAHISDCKGKGHNFKTTCLNVTGMTVVRKENT